MAKYNLYINQGSTFDFFFVVKEDGVVRDLTGYSARGEIRSKHSSSTILATFTCDIPTFTDGKITVGLSAATTAALASGCYYYDIEIHSAPDNTGLVERLLEGRVTVSPEVTRG